MRNEYWLIFRNKCVTNCLTVRLLRSIIRGGLPRVRIAHKWKNASSERGREEARALFFFLLQPRCLDSRHPPRSRTLGTDPDLRRSPEISRRSHRHPRCRSQRAFRHLKKKQRAVVDVGAWPRWKREPWRT